MTTQVPDLKRLGLPKFDDGGDPGAVSLEPLAEQHREGLRTCCDPEDPVWQIYPVNMSGKNFDSLFDLALQTGAQRVAFAVLQHGAVRGTSSYLNIVAERQTLEIGSTFLAREARGTGLNGRVKRLMLDCAFACRFRRAEFRVDARNARSQAAVLKLGAVKEGVARADRVTWTGHVRDTAVFSILDHEWAARNAG